jgi:hypothetical protein
MPCPRKLRRDRPPLADQRILICSSARGRQTQKDRKDHNLAGCNAVAAGHRARHAVPLRIGHLCGRIDCVGDEWCCMPNGQMRQGQTGQGPTRQNPIAQAANLRVMLKIVGNPFRRCFVELPGSRLCANLRHAANQTPGKWNGATATG